MTTREYQQAGGEGELLWGSKARQDVPLPDKDSRAYALDALANYIASLTFQMTGTKNGQTVPFKIPLKNIFLEWPDFEELAEKGNEDFPRVGFEIVEQNDDYPGLVAAEVEGSDDVFAPGTVLMRTSEHIETLDMHVLCRSRAERRAILAGLELAMNPVQEFLGLRFRLPAYFDSSCRITLEGGGRVEDQDAARNRRLLKLRILLRVPNLYLVKLEQFNPEVIVDIVPEGSDNGPTG